MERCEQIKINKQKKKKANKNKKKKKKAINQTLTKKYKQTNKQTNN
jgi:hypothetical protein